MKIFRRVLLAVVVLVIVAVAIVFFKLDGILRSTIESASTSSLNLPTTLKSASLAIFGGKLNLTELDIASPKGFTADHMLELGGLGVHVSYGQLTKEPIRIQQITITKPKFVLEQVDGKMNFKVVMDTIPKSDPNRKLIKVIIDELTVTDALVDIRLGNIAGMADMKPIQVTVPSMTLKNIGNSDDAKNGAAISDVVMQVATALAGKARESANLPAQFKGLLTSNLNDVAGKLGGQFSKQLDGMTQGLQGQLEKVVPGVDVKKIIPGGDNVIPKDIGKNLGGLLGGDKKDKDPQKDK